MDITSTVTLPSGKPAVNQAVKLKRRYGLFDPRAPAGEPPSFVTVTRRDPTCHLHQLVYRARHFSNGVQLRWIRELLAAGASPRIRALDDGAEAVLPEPAGGRRLHYEYADPRRARAAVFTGVTRLRSITRRLDADLALARRGAPGAVYEWLRALAADGVRPQARLRRTAPTARARALLRGGDERARRLAVTRDRLEYDPEFRRRYVAAYEARQAAGSLAAHRRWHVGKNRRGAACEHCQKEKR